VHRFVFEKDGVRDYVSLAVLHFKQWDFGHQYYVLGQQGMQKFAREELATQSVDECKTFLRECSCGRLLLDSDELDVQNILYCKKQYDTCCGDFFEPIWAGKRASAFLIVAFHVAKTNGMHNITLEDDASIERDQACRPVHCSAKSTLLGGRAFYEKWGFNYNALRRTVRDPNLVEDRVQDETGRVHKWYRKVEDWNATLNISPSGRYGTYEAWRQACVSNRAWMPTEHCVGEVEEIATDNRKRFREIQLGMRSVRKREHVHVQAAFGHSQSMPSLHLLRI